ncbi:1-acyl-sn-glycerol-3-phosphate acyltransferase epsilon [Chamberlinius hualienensis]
MELNSVKKFNKDPKKGENKGHSIIGVFPTMFLFLCAPQTYLLWLSWRVLSVFASRTIYTRGTDAIFSFYQRLVLFVIEHVMDTEIILYGDVDAILSKKDRTLYLANHQSYVDWALAEALAIRNGNLHKVRYVMKNSIQFVPLYGPFLLEHKCIYVNRESFNQTKMIDTLKDMMKQNLESWIVVYPEGTRYDPASTKIIETSNKRAEDQGLTRFQHVLTPRPKGITMILDEMRNHLDAVYDITMAYEGSIDPHTGLKKSAPNMIEYMSSRKRRLHVHIRRFSLDSMPTSDTELKEWLNDVFIKKEKLLDTFYKDDGSKWASNKIFGNGVVSKPKLWSTLPVFILSTSALISLLCTSIGRDLYWKTWVFGSLGGYAWLGLKSIL